MNKIKQRRTETIALITLTALVVVSAATATGLLVAQAAKIYMTLNDGVIASIYVAQLAVLYQLVTWLQPRRRRNVR